MRASSSFVFLVATTAMATLAACAITSGDGGSEDGDDDVEDACVSSNESDVGRCDVDCDAAVLGEDDVYECTTSCTSDTDCSGSRICVELTDGTGACLEDCSTDGTCSGTGDGCDVELLVCLPGSGVDDTCDVETVSDAASCDEDCDTILEGDTAFKCTVGCDPDAQDCGDDDLRCVTLDDGTGGCVEDCAGGATCSDPGDHCEASLEVCLPGSEVPDGDGLCDPLNVSDPSTCDVDCDTYFEGADGVYQCTVSCDPAVQDCGDGFYCATLSDDSDSVCAFDCADGLICPTDSVCDEVSQVCIPDTVSP